MSLTIETQPAAIALSRNPMRFQIVALDDSSERYGTTGARAWMQFDVETGMPDTNTVTLEWTEPSGLASAITFTAVQLPDIITEIPADHEEYATFDEYLLAIAAVFNAHPAVVPFFIAFVDEATNRVYIESRSDSTDWTVEFTGSPGASITLGDSAATSNTPPEGYAVVLDVFVERDYASGEYVHAASLTAAPNQDSEAWFDISGILHEEGLIGLPDPPLPVWGTDAPYLAPTLRNYYVRIVELNGAETTSELTDIKQYMLGGIAQNLFADYDFFTAMGEANSLLTWRPDARDVAVNSPEYLAWFNYTGDVAEVKLEFSFRTPSATETEYIYTNHGTDVPENGILIFPVGLQTMLDKLAIENDAILFYQVRVLTNDSDPEGTVTPLSQAQGYYVDRRYYEDVRFLQYLNGFWLPETVRCTGHFAQSLQVQREDSERILSPDYTSTTAEQFQYTEDWQQYFTYHTGYMRRFDLDALQELLIFGRAFEVYETGYIPLKLRGSSWKIHETGENLYTAQIETMPALRSLNYSNINIQIITEQEDGWELVAADYWRTVAGQVWQIA